MSWPTTSASPASCSPSTPPICKGEHRRRARGRRLRELRAGGHHRAHPPAQGIAAEKGYRLVPGHDPVVWPAFTAELAARAVSPLVVRGGQVVVGINLRAADVVVDDERIVPWSSRARRTTRCDVIDGRRSVGAPGAIDPHVTSTNPVAPSGGLDCAARPPPRRRHDGGRHADRLRSAHDDSARCTPRRKPPSARAASTWPSGEDSSRRRRNLDELVAAGAVGFKAFACPSGWDDFPAVDEPTLVTGLQVAARLDVRVALHCELESLGHRSSRRSKPFAGPARSPEQSGAHLHVVHVSSGGRRRRGSALARRHHRDVARTTSR